MSMRRIAVGFVVCALCGTAAAPPARAGDARRTAALVEALRTKRIPEAKFADVSLDDVVKFLQVVTGHNFVVKRRAIEKAGIDLTTVRAKCELTDVTVATLLEIVLEPHGLVAVVDGNVVYLTTKADALGPPILVMHPISHLTWTKTNFRGPDIDLHPSGYVAPDDRPEEEEDEDDPFRDPQHVADLVKEMVTAPWTDEGWGLTATKQWLLVKAPRSVQRQVERALAQMEAMK